MTAPGDAPPGRPGLLRWCFEDRRSGRIVVVQRPNLLAWIAILGGLAQILLHPTRHLATAVLVVTGLALAWWALDELIRGANPWRRLLGAAALAYLATRIWSLAGA